MVINLHKRSSMNITVRWIISLVSDNTNTEPVAVINYYLSSRYILVNRSVKCLLWCCGLK